MTERLLPETFADLEPFVAHWSLPTMAARHAQRLRSDPAERERLFAIMKPRLGEVVDHLNGHPLDAMPEDAQRLFQLALSFMEVTMTVEMLNASLEAVHAKSARHVRILRELDGR